MTVADAMIDKEPVTIGVTLVAISPALVVMLRDVLSSFFVKTVSHTQITQINDILPDCIHTHFR